MKFFPVASPITGILSAVFTGLLCFTPAFSRGENSSAAQAAGAESRENPQEKAREKLSSDELIALLGAESFKERRQAQRELNRRGENSYAPVLEACIAGYFRYEDPEVKHRLKELMEAMVTENLFTKPRGFLGITMALGSELLDGKKRVHGVEVVMIVPDSAAEAAGLVRGDLIYQVDDLVFTAASKIETFSSFVGAKKAGTKIKLKIVRGGNKLVEAVATLRARPDQIAGVLYTNPRETAEEYFEKWFETQIELHQKPANK